MNLGSDYICQLNINYDENPRRVPKNAELFMFATDWYNHKYYNQSEFKDIENWRLKNLILPLLSQLEENKALFIDDDNEAIISKQKFIAFITENEEAELIPSPLWTSFNSNIKRFHFHEIRDLWKHISEKVISRVIVIKKLKEEIIEVNSVFPIPEWFSQDYNILNSIKCEQLKDWFSCPVIDCIWKPTTLWWSSETDSINLDYWSLEDIDDETTNRILRHSFLQSIENLNIIGLHGFNNVFNIIKISKSFPQIKINFDLMYRFITSERKETKLEVKSNQIIWVFKGKMWSFESSINSSAFLPLNV